MSSSIWRRWLASATSWMDRREPRRKHFYRPGLELLEDRLAPATVMNNADSGAGSLRQAILDTPAAGTITFAPALNNQTITLTTGELVINKALNIIGPGASLLTIDGNNASRIFNVDDSASSSIVVSISGLHLTRGSSQTLGGGAIRNNNEVLTVTGCLLEFNRAQDSGGGGAIKNNSGTMTVSNSVFYYNTADELGGAILNGGTLTLTNSSLVSNHTFTDNGGGGIFNAGNLTITNSTLSQNSSDYRGGAIRNYSGTLTITNSTLADNHANSAGGAIYCDSGNVTLTNSTLSGNSQLSSVGFIVGGGAIFNDSGDLNATNTIFSSNNSAVTGGAIFNSVGATVRLANSLVIGNSANSLGGAIRNLGILQLTDVTASSNKADSHGGAIDADSSGDVTIIKSTFNGNSAGVAGGGLRNYGTLAITNSTFSANAAAENGGAIFNGGTLFVSSSTIVANRADSDGANGGTGGGIVTGNAGTLLNNIIAGNVAGSGNGTPSDIANTVAAGFNNLIGDPNSAGGLTNGNNNILGNGAGALLPLASILDPILRNNGGATQTHALIPGSTAINTGNNSALSAASEQQTVTLSGTLSGTFTLTLTGPDATSNTTSATTGSLTGDSPTLAADTQNALNSLANIGGVGGSVAVSKLGNVLTVTFGGTLANTDVLQMKSTASGGLTVAVATAEPGHAAFTTDQRGPGFPRIVDTNADIGAYEAPRALFTDDFNRANSGALGGPWVNGAGAVGIVGNTAQGLTVNANVTVLNGFSAADVDLYADAFLLAGAQSGLVARYVDVNNYYGATLTKESTGLITARLIKFFNGVYTELAVLENTAVSGKLRLRVVGNTLKMFLDSTLLATAIDFSLAAGSVGMRTFGNVSRLDNFQAWPISTGITHFDPFTKPDDSALRGPWVSSEGYFTTVGNRIQGGAAINRAVLQGAAQPDVDLRTHVSITGTGHFASLLARYNGAADSWYQGTLVRDTSATMQAFLFRRSGGGFTQLGAMATIPAVSGSVNARLLVVGSTLKLFINAQLVVQATDTMLATGTVGLRSDNFASFDNFDVKAVRAELPFTENFSGQALDLPWVDQVAPFTLTGGQAVPSNSALSLTTLAGVNAHSAEVQADIAITNTGGVGSLVLGYNGPGNSNYYTALAYREPGNAPATPFSLYLFRRDASTYVQLGPRVQVAALGTLKFRMLGNQLTLLLNNVQQITATNNTFTRGSVGIRGFVDPASAGTVTIDNFTATNLNFLPFVDNFNADTLDPNWMVRAGGYATTLAADKLQGTTAFNYMSLGRVTIADVDASVNVAVLNQAGNFANLVTRVSADGLSFYLATVYWTGTQFNADIFKNVGGAFTQLGSFNLGNGAGNGTGILRFTAIGGQLKLFFAGTELLSVYDFSLTTGSVGLRSSLNTTFDDFSLSAAT